MKITSYFLMRKAFLFSAILLLTVLFSCKKDGKLTPDFDNGNLSINFVDTFSITTSVLQEDSLRTDLSTSNLLGIYNDPIFGFVSSSIYSQVLLTGADLNFGTIHTIDSVVLTLDYAGLYGDATSPMSINVYELTSPLDESTDYYSNNYTAHDPTALASLSFTPNLTDSIDLDFDTITYKPHLRIKLNNTFGQKILDADTLTQLNDNAGFTAFMNGLHITTTDSVTNSSLLAEQGAIAYFDMNSTMSTLTLYYNDTSTYDFTISSDAAKYSRFDQNYSGTDVEKHLNNDPNKDTNRIYVATMGRVRSKIELPTIKDLTNDGAVTINKAELIFTIEDLSEGTFDNALSTISLAGIDANGDAVFLTDFFEGPDHYGGTYDETTKSYTFNISRHIHQLIYNTTTDYGLYLIGNSSSTSANRAVIGSESSPTNNIRLEITYSKI